jgi:hypothetical protein
LEVVYVWADGLYPTFRTASVILGDIQR